MKAILRKEISFKDGTTWKPGQTIEINVNSDRPAQAQLVSHVNTDYGIYKKVRSTHLYKWFKEFYSFDMDDLEEAVSEGVTVSLTGENVELDGWDCYGMPSILLASGMI